MTFDTRVIVNPASAGGATRRRWPEIQAAIDRMLPSWEPRFTTGPNDATELARAAVHDGVQMIVCVGGDGTMNEVVTGLFAPSDAGISDRLIRDDVIIAPVRQGTGGDFARFVGLTGRLPKAVEHLCGEATRSCDLGLVEFEDFDGAPKRRAFLNIASFGMSGLVADKVNGTPKVFGGSMTFLVGLGRALAAYRPQRVRLRIDGEPFFEDQMVTTAVANGQFFGGGMHFAPRAAYDDGLLDVVVQSRSGIKEVLSIRDLYNGRIIEWPSAKTGRARRVEAFPVDADDTVLLDIDGEQPGRLPATFRVLPGAVRLKVAESPIGQAQS